MKIQKIDSFLNENKPIEKTTNRLKIEQKKMDKRIRKRLTLNNKKIDTETKQQKSIR